MSDMKQRLKSVIFLSFLLLSGITAHSHSAAIEGDGGRGKKDKGLRRFLKGCPERFSEEGSS